MGETLAVALRLGGSPALTVGVTEPVESGVIAAVPAAEAAAVLLLLTVAAELPVPLLVKEELAVSLAVAAELALSLAEAEGLAELEPVALSLPVSVTDWLAPKLKLGVPL